MLEPVFTTVSNRFLCHLKYKQPRHLYQLDYTVYMPNLGYTLKKRTKFAKGGRKFNEKGVFTSEFITARHDAFPNIYDEIILIGSNFDNYKKATQFSVHGLKKPHQFNKRKKFKVRPHRAALNANKIYSTLIQLEKPFLYSSKTFYKGGCTEKNFSDIYPSQSIYLPHSINVEITKTKTGAAFEYQTANKLRSAYIRMSIGRYIKLFRFRFIVFNATFNNISVISWRSVLFVEETGDWSLWITDVCKMQWFWFCVILFHQFINEYIYIYVVTFFLQMFKCSEI